MTTPAGSGAPLPPPEFGLALDPAVRRPRPEILVGGQPIRVLRLRTAGAARVDGWAAGEPIGRAPGGRALARRLLDAGIAHPRPPAGAGPAATDVTVVIPVRDRAGGLAETLQALEPTAPVVVVDDGSQVPVGPMTTSMSTDGVAVIRHDAPRGPAAARNTGWRAASTPFVAFLDADCLPAAGWLNGLLPHFADEAVGAVAPRITAYRGPRTPPALGAYEECRSPLDLGSREANVRPGSVVPYVPTAALVVRRRAMADAGGFDEQLRFGEDVDLVWRLGRMGWRVRYQPAAIVGHPARESVGAWARQRYDYGRSATPLAARHGRAVAPAAMSPWTAAAWGLAATGHPVAGAGLVVAVTAGAGSPSRPRPGHGPDARRPGPDRQRPGRQRPGPGRAAGLAATGGGGRLSVGPMAANGSSGGGARRRPGDPPGDRVVVGPAPRVGSVAVVRSTTGR